MPEKVTIREDLQIIQVDSYGDVTAEDMQHSLDAVVAINKERGFTKIFVDATKETSIPHTLPLFQFGEDISKTIISLTFAVAISEEVREDLIFIENVVQNRGVQMRMFNTEDEALEWLMKQ